MWLLLLLGLCHGGDNNQDGESVVYALQVSEPEIRHHCFYRRMKYTPALLFELPSHESDIFACQRRCAKNARCKYFSFYSNFDCVLAGEGAITVEEKGATAGPQECSKVMASCRELPGPDFPGATVAESKKAWPSGHVPSPFECWPVDYDSRTFKSCPTVQVLQNLSTGLSGRCENLEETVVPLYKSCRSICEARTMCSMFQVNESGCFLGVRTSGMGCYKPNSIRSEIATRYLRGDVRVLLDLRGVQILGLRKAFSENDFPGDPRTEGVRACRYSCYSNLDCSYWQYLIGEGCWLHEGLHNAVPFPLTTGYFRRGYEQAIAGEYIQHFCPGLGWTASEEWKLVADATNCSAPGIKDLAGSDTLSVAECQRRAATDLDCGPQMASNSLACFCVIKGQLCNRMPNRFGFRLYERRSLVHEVAAVTDMIQPASLPYAPAGTDSYDISIHLHGVNYVELSKDLESFEKAAAQAVKNAAGAAPGDLQDSSGASDRITVASSSKDDFVHLRFTLQLPEGDDAETLSRALWSSELKDALHAAARAVTPASITGPVKLSVAFSSAGDESRHARKSSHGPLFYITLTLVTLGLLIFLFCMCCDQKTFRGYCGQVELADCCSSCPGEIEGFWHWCLSWITCRHDGICDDTDSEEEWNDARRLRKKSFGLESPVAAGEPVRLVR